MPKIAVVDYHAGNLRSVTNALNFLNADFFISDDPAKLKLGDKMIFPGVGNAASAMDTLHGLGLAGMIKEYAATGKPLFGICLGSQILLDHSEEGDTQCLGIISGQAKLLKSDTLKIPQIGWNQVYKRSNHYLFQGIDDGAPFYFVHSYYTVPEHAAHALCETEYGISYASGIHRDNVCAVQFHPERSGKWGLKMLENFINHA